MGRNKIEIEKIQNFTKRKAKFSKRQKGLMKKAYELSVLCDVDIGVIAFSPGGKATQFGPDEQIEDVITRYANIPRAERAKAKFNVEYPNKMAQSITDEGARLFPDINEYINSLNSPAELLELKLQLECDVKKVEKWMMERDNQLGPDVGQSAVQQRSDEIINGLCAEDASKVGSTANAALDVDMGIWRGITSFDDTISRFVDDNMNWPC